MRFSTFFMALGCFVAVNACNCGDGLTGTTGNLHGTICDADRGAPLVSVRAERAGGRKKKTAPPGADGSFVFQNVAVGKSPVTADDNGTPRTIGIELAEGETEGFIHA